MKSVSFSPITLSYVHWINSKIGQELGRGERGKLPFPVKATMLDAESLVRKLIQIFLMKDPTLSGISFEDYLTFSLSPNGWQHRRVPI